jgi:hypothetical protein
MYFSPSHKLCLINTYCKVNSAVPSLLVIVVVWDRKTVLLTVFATYYV